MSIELLPNLQANPQGSQIIDYREVGATGLRRFSGFVYDEFLLELTSWKGAAIYREMAYNDPVVAAVLFLITMLCREVEVYVQAASTGREDVEACDFVGGCLEDMSQPIGDTLIEILSMVTYGYSFHEIVYKKRMGDSMDPSMRSKFTDGRVGWRKWPIRSQDTVYRWQFDDHGGLQGMEQLAPPHYYHVTIPVEKALLFRTTPVRNNPEGLSSLRGAYRPWYMKKNIENIEAIGVERDLAGLPVAWVPVEYLSQNSSAQQKAILAKVREMTMNVRRNQGEGIVLPLDYDQNGKQRFDFKLLSTGGKRQFDTNAIINRYDHRIALTLLADFILLGQQSVGSFSLVDSRTNLFSTAIGAFLDMILDTINRFAIPRLFALNNFKITNYPIIKRGKVGNPNLKELGDFIQKLSGANMKMFPSKDGELEKYLLKTAHLPNKGIIQPPQPGKGQDFKSLKGEPTGMEVPHSAVERPQDAGDVNDRTPADGQPKTDTVVTDVTGNAEITSRAYASQNENQYTRFLSRGGP